MIRVLKDCVDFELKMIENAKIKHILPVKSIDKSGQRVLYHGDDYKELMTDAGFIDKGICLKIFEALKSLYENIGDYLLSFDKLSLNANDIFISKSGEIAFAYLPEKTVEKSFVEKLENLCDVLISKMDNEEEVLKVRQNLSINKEEEVKNVDYLLELFNSKF